MKQLKIKISLLSVVVFLAFSGTGCKEQKTMKTDKAELNTIFPKGEAGPAENFTGKAWNYGLVANDSTYNTLVGNVYFEPGARSNWHIHPAGQILIITDGEGFHQIKGQSRERIKKGDVVKCPPNVMHWHGASPKTGMQQMYIIANTEKGIVKWLKPVTDEEYNNDNQLAKKRYGKGSKKYRIIKYQMARIFITGSTDGLGQLAAKELVKLGHQVVLHARNTERGKQALANVPGAETVVTADLSDVEETKLLATKVNALGTFDAVIHNAGVYQAPAKDIFAVNTLAPYILTCLIKKPKRLIYLSSDLHESGHAKLESFKSDLNRITYSDSKLHVVLLCKAIARKWPNVYANALNPGWVPTKMGGAGAPDSLEGGFQTQVWLAVSNDEKAKVSGRYFYHLKEKRSNPEADNVELQERFMDLCRQITGVSFPE